MNRSTIIKEWKNKVTNRFYRTIHLQLLTFTVILKVLRVLEKWYLECEWVSMAREPHNCGSWRARQVCKAVTFQVETLQAFNSARRLWLVIHSFINNFLSKSRLTVRFCGSYYSLVEYALWNGQRRTKRFVTTS